MRSAKPEFTGQVVGPSAAARAPTAATTPSSSPAPPPTLPNCVQPLPQRMDPAELPRRLRQGARLLPPTHPRRAEADLRERHPRDHAPLQQALAGKIHRQGSEAAAAAKTTSAERQNARRPSTGRRAFRSFGRILRRGATRPQRTCRDRARTTAWPRWCARTARRAPIRACRRRERMTSRLTPAAKRLSLNFFLSDFTFEVHDGSCSGA